MTRRDLAKAAGAAALAPAAAAVPPVTSAFSPGDGEWKIAWPARLAQHDLVYLSPLEDPSLGLPLGNGDLGALLWTTSHELVLAINKCDTWDDNEERPFGSWSAAEEERHTSLRHCGRLTIDFGCPVLDLLYQQEFEARLELASATASVQAATPFAGVTASAYVSHENRVLVVRCEARGAEPYPRRVTLERWGSRTFAHWYSQVNRDARHGLGGTATRVERGRIVIEQKLRTLSFALVAQVIADIDAQPARLHARAGAVDLPAAEAAGFTVLVTAVTSENDPDPVGAAHRILDRAAAQGEPAVRQAHEDEWRRFWPASMIDIPEKYLENIWHLSLYLANSASRGAYPPHFCNGLWGWNRDFVPWNYYFQWNMQWYAWPLAAANHAELAEPYYRLRSVQFPRAVEYARDRLKKPGAFYADVSDRRGYNDIGVNHNHTAGAQVALDFWRQYEFTGDERFLRDSAWPVIREVARFNSACLVAQPDGLYHLSGTSAYEGSPLFDDTITDLAMIRALFPVAVRVAKKMGHDAAEIALWEKQLAALAPFRLVDLEGFEYEKPDAPVHAAGVGAGKPLASKKVFAVGRDAKGKWVRNRFAGRPEMAYYGIPDPEIAPVFPAGVIGLAGRDSELFRAAVTQVRLHPPTTPDTTVTAGSMTGAGEKTCMGWCPYPIVLARLGLAEELLRELANSVSTWQFYPQGFGHYGPFRVFRRDLDLRWNENMVRDAATVVRGKEPVKFPFPTWPFRHFDNEALPIVACALNEMLLQSHEGAIRVFPALPEDGEARFDLSAAGGFRVSAERLKTGTAWVAVRSTRGGTCRVFHPWPGTRAFCLELPGGREVALDEAEAGPDRVLSWKTEPDRGYLLVRDTHALATWQTVPAKPAPRKEPRRLKNARLGRERMF